MENPIILAIDVSNLEQVSTLLEQTAPHIAGVKLGLQLIHAIGTPRAVKCVKDYGVKLVFLDCKLFDIGNTVKEASLVITANGGVDIFNVAGAAGFEAIRQAANCQTRAKVFVVTVLTSLSEEDCQLTYGGSIKATVLKWARWAKLAGAAGIICSAQHLEFLHKNPELEGLEYITPGVRSPGAAADDQKQIDTPANAIRNGATYIVIGREVTQSKDPIGEVQRILRDIETAVAAKGA